MIEYLRGNLLSVEDDHVVVDAGGVGYGLDVPQSTLKRLPAPGEAVELHVVMVVREDAMTLYGFRTREERKVFDIFLGISGIGPRTALDVLSSLSITDFVSAVRMNNVQKLIQVPGIGRKKAERMIVELKDRLKLFPGDPRAEGDGGEGTEVLPGERDLFEDAVLAMQALGYKPAEAGRSVTAAIRSLEGQSVSVETLVRQALQLNR